MCGVTTYVILLLINQIYVVEPHLEVYGRLLILLQLCLRAHSPVPVAGPRDTVAGTGHTSAPHNTVLDAWANLRVTAETLTAVQTNAAQLARSQHHWLPATILKCIYFLTDIVESD